MMSRKAINISQIILKLVSVFLCLLAIGCAGGSGAISDEDKLILDDATKKKVYDIDDPFRKGDFVRVELSGVPTGEQDMFELKVDEAGNISMPHIGSIKAEGLNSASLKEKIELMYKMSQIYNNPTISVTSQQARFVSVNGEVRAPQRIYHAKDLTALGAIATCGGFTDFSDQKNIKLLRDGKVIQFNAVEMFKDPSKDIPLLPEDIIQVQKSIW